MEEAAGAPAYSGIVAMLPVTDVQRTITFCEQLGLRTGNTFTPDGASTPEWAWLYNGQAHVMISRAEGPVEATHQHVSLWLYTRDVKAAHALLASRGMDVGDIAYPFYNPGGEFHVHDPDGHAWFIAHAD